MKLEQIHSGALGFAYIKILQKYTKHQTLNLGKFNLFN